jgi:uncharacterized protein YegJ (DUF2314 family)
LPDGLNELANVLTEMPFFDIQASNARTMAPLIDTIRSRGRSDYVDRLAGFRNVIAVRTSDLCIPPRAGFWAAFATALAIAQRHSGMVLDVDTLRLVNTSRPFSEFHEQGVPCFTYFVSCPTSKQGDTYWMTTEGMGRFGCAELQIVGIPLIDINRLSFVLVALCQKLSSIITQQIGALPAESTTIPLPTTVNLSWSDFKQACGESTTDPVPKGCAGEAVFGLDLRKALQGDAEMLTVVKPADVPGDFGAWLHGVVRAFFPSEDYIGSPTSESAMNSAHKHALATLPDAKQRYLRGEFASGHFGVKKAYPVGDVGFEFLWIEVKTWTGDRIVGELVNEPRHVPGLALGQRVELTDSEIYDWVAMMPGRAAEGHFTDSVIESADDNASPPPISEVEKRLLSRYREYLNKLRQPYEERHWGWIPWWLSVPARMLKIRPPFSHLRPGFTSEIYDAIAANGRFVVAYVVIANKLLMRDGKDDAPCLAVISFDESVGHDQLFDIATTISSVKGQEPVEPALKVAAEMVNNEEYVPFKRTQVPIELTGGKVVYAVHLMLFRQHLIGGKLIMPAISCLAEPGDVGKIIQLPLEIVTGVTN